MLDWKGWNLVSSLFDQLVDINDLTIDISNSVDNVTDSVLDVIGEISPSELLELLLLSDVSHLIKDIS